MGFDVPATAYDKFMGRYSTLLAPGLCDLVGVRGGWKAVDVGAGSGALTAELVARLGADSVVAIDPSVPFVAALRERFPDVTVHEAAAEALPLPDDAYDAALAQLVVQFMSEPAAGIAEMRRVTKPGGVVAVSVWDHGTGRGPLSPFWAVALQVDPGARDESTLTGTNEGELAALLRHAGLRNVEETALQVEVEHPTFEEWWEPYELGVGPAGAYVVRLDPASRETLREGCREALPPAPFRIAAHAWTAVGVA
jgi:SAM-dependent methyltransferase